MNTKKKTKQEPTNLSKMTYEQAMKKALNTPLPKKSDQEKKKGGRQRGESQPGGQRRERQQPADERDQKRCRRQRRAGAAA